MLSIVLGRRDVGESDQMVSFYTAEAGKINALAKGIKKITSKNSSNLSEFCLADIELAEGKEIDRLTKVQPVSLFKNIYGDLDKIMAAGYVAGLTDEAISEKEKDRRIFDLLLSVYAFIDETEKINALNIITAYIYKLWHCLGFSLEKAKDWLENDWEKINVIKSAKKESEDAYRSAIEFAEYHSGRRFGKYNESDKIR